VVDLSEVLYKVYGGPNTSGCLFSIFHLVSMMCMRYLTTLWCMAFNVFFVAMVFS
jgi:hypothetical protein